jgi:hypothetical protein
MSISCPTAPANKKEYVTDIGKILVKDYGKKKSNLLVTDLSIYCICY